MAFTSTDEGDWYNQEDWYAEGCDDCNLIKCECN